MAMSNLTYVVGMTALGCMALIVLSVIYLALTSARSDHHSPTATR